MRVELCIWFFNFRGWLSHKIKSFLIHAIDWCPWINYHLNWFVVVYRNFNTIRIRVCYLKYMPYFLYIRIITFQISFHLFHFYFLFTFRFHMWLKWFLLWQTEHTSLKIYNFCNLQNHNWNRLILAVSMSWAVCDDSSAFSLVWFLFIGIIIVIWCFIFLCLDSFLFLHFLCRVNLEDLMLEIFSGSWSGLGLFSFRNFSRS